MALEYVVTKRVFGFDKDKNEKYVAKSVRSGRVSFSKMCGKVSRLCGVHRKVSGSGRQRSCRYDGGGH